MHPQHSHDQSWDIPISHQEWANRANSAKNLAQNLIWIWSHFWHSKKLVNFWCIFSNTLTSVLIDSSWEEKWKCQNTLTQFSQEFWPCFVDWRGLNFLDKVKIGRLSKLHQTSGELPIMQELSNYSSPRVLQMLQISELKRTVIIPAIYFH